MDPTFKNWQQCLRVHKIIEHKIANLQKNPKCCKNSKRTKWLRGNAQSNNVGGLQFDSHASQILFFAAIIFLSWKSWKQITNTKNQMLNNLVISFHECNCSWVFTFKNIFIYFVNVLIGITFLQKLFVPDILLSWDQSVLKNPQIIHPNWFFCGGGIRWTDSSRNNFEYDCRI